MSAQLAQGKQGMDDLANNGSVSDSLEDDIPRIGMKSGVRRQRRAEQGLVGAAMDLAE